MPSLYFCDGSYARSCGNTPRVAREETKERQRRPRYKFGFLRKGGGGTHVFPAEGRPALDAVDVAHRVVPRGHLSVVWLAFNHVYPGAPMRSLYEHFHPQPGIERETHTPSKRYARPCCPLNAFRRDRRGSDLMKRSRRSRTYAGHHGMDRGEVCLAGRASVDAGTGKITTVAHAHGWRSSSRGCGSG